MILTLNSVDMFMQVLLFDQVNNIQIKFFLNSNKNYIFIEVNTLNKNARGHLIKNRKQSQNYNKNQRRLKNNKISA